MQAGWERACIGRENKSFGDGFIQYEAEKKNTKPAQSEMDQIVLVWMSAMVKLSVNQIVILKLSNNTQKN